MISPVFSTENSSFSAALVAALAHHGLDSVHSPDVLGFGVQRLQGQIHAAIEQIKYESEQALFSNRNEEEETGEALNTAMDAAYALEYVRSEMSRDGGAALLSQANVTHGATSQLLFS